VSAAGGVPVVGVVGPGDCDEASVRTARELGERLARAGCVVVNGGLGGVMRAVSEGVRSAGGVVLGILPSADPRDANPFVTHAIATGLGEARNAVLVNTAAGLVAVAGEYGTLSEIALARRAGKPVVVLGVQRWPVAEHDASVVRARDPADAVGTLLALLAAGKPGDAGRVAPSRQGA
jgi:uncharacterized protein (TIGR00725 family)